jgi:hypothetical protein
MSIMENKYNIKQWIEKFDNGDFDNEDRKIQIEAGWYDWFCDDSELSDRLQYLGHIIKELSNSPRINIETTSVSFRNVCPLEFPLYDTINFNKGYNPNDTLYWIEIGSPSVKCKFGLFEIKHAIRTGFIEPVFKCDTEKELIQWFNY